MYGVQNDDRYLNLQMLNPFVLRHTFLAFHELHRARWHAGRLQHQLPILSTLLAFERSQRMVQVRRQHGKSRERERETPKNKTIVQELQRGGV